MTAIIIIILSLVLIIVISNICKNKPRDEEPKDLQYKKVMQNKATDLIQKDKIEKADQIEEITAPQKVLEKSVNRAETEKAEQAKNKISSIRSGDTLVHNNYGECTVIDVDEKVITVVVQSTNENKRFIKNENLIEFFDLCIKSADKSAKKNANFNRRSRPLSKRETDAIYRRLNMADSYYTDSSRTDYYYSGGKLW